MPLALHIRKPDKQFFTDTVVLVGELELLCSGIVYPAERMTWEYPGCPAYIEVQNCTNKTDNQDPWDILEEHWDEIESQLWDSID